MPPFAIVWNKSRAPGLLNLSAATRRFRSLEMRESRLDETKKVTTTMLQASPPTLKTMVPMSMLPTTPPVVSMPRQRARLPMRALNPIPPMMRRFKAHPPSLCERTGADERWMTLSRQSCHDPLVRDRRAGERSQHHRARTFDLSLLSNYHCAPRVRPRPASLCPQGRTRYPWSRNRAGWRHLGIRCASKSVSHCIISSSPHQRLLVD